MKPLAGRTILVTRSKEQAGDLSRLLGERGARVMEAPVIAFEDPLYWVPVDEAIGRIDRYDWTIFTSANAVERFLTRMDSMGCPAGKLNKTNLAAIGPATAERLRSVGLTVALLSPTARAEALLERLSEQGAVAGKRILIPRAAVAREILPEGLRTMGARVDVVTVYRTVPVPLAKEILDLLRIGGIDLVTFTSSSTVTNLLARLEEIGGLAALEGVSIAVLGPVTAQTARERGLSPQIVAAGASMADLVEAIAAHYYEVS